MLKTSNIKQKFRLRRAKSVKNDLNTTIISILKKIAARRATILKTFSEKQKKNTGAHHFSVVTFWKDGTPSFRTAAPELQEFRITYSMLANKWNSIFVLMLRNCSTNFHLFEFPFVREKIATDCAFPFSKSVRFGLGKCLI